MDIETDCPHCEAINRTKVELYQIFSDKPNVIVCNSCNNYYAFTTTLLIETKEFKLTQ